MLTKECLLEYVTYRTLMDIGRSYSMNVVLHIEIILLYLWLKLMYLNSLVWAEWIC